MCVCVSLCGLGGLVMVVLKSSDLIQVGEWLRGDMEGYLHCPGQAADKTKLPSVPLCQLLAQRSAEVEEEEWAGWCQQLYWHACRVQAGVETWHVQGAISSA